MNAFRLGYVPGVMPAKWASRWAERETRTPLELVQLPLARQREALLDKEVDAALVRLPATPHDEWEMFSMIALYRETSVVAMSVDHYLSAAEDLICDDLHDEPLWQSADDPLHWRDDTRPGTAPAYAEYTPPQGAGDAIEIVATGAGVVILPLSLARLHHRKDVTFRPLQDGPEAPVGIAWLAERSTNDDPLLDTIVGIVRGRTAQSSRGTSAATKEVSAPKKEKKPVRQNLRRAHNSSKNRRPRR
ncbi:LysR family transcriptional regulator [Hoyosella rhizosphaerae]|uniref:LysR family transcriptional regulator n=1 Tax=Hoyosella rhizosphaerae TaxID=1755582 RepID=A0A916U9Q7_9ACTN|nr:LysR substrate-binding domain-containing protein [Hoyosella rhizosphaerae]MBN4927414.1 LysR family transcriptional regulator [Hoyosella rhizosphaerae]GGC64589.1 LysR family transcriptional regulator [Hoyosella rhizosphaerae]